MNNNFSIDIINRCIDQTNHNLTQYDVSVIVHKVFKNLYRYKGAKQWEYLDIQDNTWKHDKNKRRFKHDIKSVISDLYITRYMHWYSILNNTPNEIDTEIHARFMADKMFRASYKLKDDKFISVVIKEAESFFDIYND